MDIDALGIADALNPTTIGWVATGVLIGIIAGAIPGISGPTAIAIAVPLTFYMTPLVAIGFLVGINKGGTVGGAISAILLNTPGSADAAATALDGYPLAQQGKPLKALKLALYSSITGDSFSDIVLILLAAPLAVVALRMGPVEIFTVVVFALTIIGALAGRSIIKGLIAGFVGIFLSTIGLDPEAGTARLTFGAIELLDGIPLVALGIGTLALAEVLRQIENRAGIAKTPISLSPTRSAADNRLSWAEYRSCFRTIARSALIGTAVGATPGIGSTVASFLGYAAARRASSEPEKFGTGKLEGVAAAEAANSSVVGANLIPLLALGIPGNVSAALLVGAFIIHGITPGPLLFEQHGRLVYGLFGAMVIANFCNLIIGNLGLRFFAFALRMPTSVIFPTIVLLCLTGGYISGGGMFSVGATICFAILGYFLRKLEFSFVTFVIGFVLGPMFELSLRQTIIILDGDVTMMASHPVAIVFLLMAVIVVILIARGRRAGA